MFKRYCDAWEWSCTVNGLTWISAVRFCMIAVMILVSFALKPLVLSSAIVASLVWSNVEGGKLWFGDVVVFGDEVVWCEGKKMRRSEKTTGDF